MPGTVHDISAIDVKSMWKTNNEIQITDEIELKVMISNVIVFPHN